jgi:hypothetical protein
MGLLNVFKKIENQTFDQVKISGSDFEDIFEDILLDEGFSVIEVEIDKELKKIILSSEVQIKNVFDAQGYIREPFNSQSFPDFLIFENDWIVPIELKTSEDSDKPMWNNSIPKQSAIYVFMAFSNIPDKREILFFKGSDVITAEASKTFKERLVEAQQQSKFSKEELVHLDTFNHGWNIYVRSNYQQSKHTAGTVTSFVDHPNKEENKKKVIKYLESITTKILKSVEM